MSRKNRVALVTSAKFPEAHWVDRDAFPIKERLVQLGCRVDLPAWDDSSVNWSDYDILVLQSPWSGWQKLSEFTEWLDFIEGVGIATFNPINLLRAGLDKIYLLKMAESGIQTVPTKYLPASLPQSSLHLRSQLQSVLDLASSSRRSIVIKPASSGGSLETIEYERRQLDTAIEHIQRLHEQNMSILIQPYISSIDRSRELGVVTIGKTISHVISKAAILKPNTTHREFHPDARLYIDLSTHQRDQILQAHRKFYEISKTDIDAPASIRLDFLFDPIRPDNLLLLEIESVAPVKFLTLFPQATAVLTDVLIAAISRVPTRID